MEISAGGPTDSQSTGMEKAVERIKQDYEKLGFVAVFQLRIKGLTFTVPIKSFEELKSQLHYFADRDWEHFKVEKDV